MIRQILQGKTIGRVLFNKEVQKHCATLSGTVLDLAGGSNASYHRFLPQGLTYIKTDYKSGKGIDKVVDVTQPLPFDTSSVDSVLFFNALYIIKDPHGLLEEIKRIMKPNSSLFISSPFLSNEMPEPHDYARLTYEGLSALFMEVGFKNFKIYRYGDRFSVIANLLHPFFVLSIIRLPVYLLCILLDKLIPVKIKKHYPTPIGYFCVIKR